MSVGSLSLASFRTAGLVTVALSFGRWPCDGLAGFAEKHRGTRLARLALLELDRRARLERD